MTDDTRRVADYPNWFDTDDVRPNFEKFLWEFRGMKNLKFLQLGAYKGDASVWMLDNILTEPSSMLVDVDTWAGSNEEVHKHIDFDQVWDYYQQRTAEYPNLTVLRSTTIHALKNMPLCHFDFIYIDADHTAVGVLLDAELSWESLKTGGIMAFDDFLWRERMDRNDLHPQPGILTFLDRHAGEFELLGQNWQLWLRKV